MKGKKNFHKKTILNTIQFLLVLLLSVFIFFSCTQVENPLPEEMPVLPEMPRNLNVVPGNKILTLSWDAAENADSYELFYNAADEPGDNSLELNSTLVTIGTETELVNGETYYIYVRSKNSAGVSGFISGEGEPALSAPAASVVRGNGKLNLGWAAEAGLMYTVYYGTDDDPDYAAKWIGTISIKDVVAGTEITGLNNYVDYFFWITAKEDGAESNFGPVSSGKPEALPVSVEDGFVYVPGGTVIGSDRYSMDVTVPNGSGYINSGKTLTKKGVFVENRKVSFDSYYMAKHETTQELWYTVQDWAEKKENNTYKFQNRKNAPGEADKNKPVAGISWRDAMIWCNAYSEKKGLEPVYYYNGLVVRDSRDANASACDGVVMNKNNNGYRLPTEVEKEFAARGGDPGKADWMFTYAGSNDKNDVWHHGNSPYTIRIVGTKISNRLGIYDLSGNVQEWGWDWMYYFVPLNSATALDGENYGGRFTQKSMSGGGVGSNITLSCVADRWSYIPSYTDNYIGFRVIQAVQ